MPKCPVCGEESLHLTDHECHRENRDASCSGPATCSVSFSIEEIKRYLEGLCLVGEHKENDMLNCAISLLEDYEDGIEAVTERRKQNRWTLARARGGSMNEVNLHIVRALRAEVQIWRDLANIFAVSSAILFAALACMVGLYIW